MGSTSRWEQCALYVNKGLQRRVGTSVLTATGVERHQEDFPGHVELASRRHLSGRKLGHYVGVGRPCGEVGPSTSVSSDGRVAIGCRLGSA